MKKMSTNKIGGAIERDEREMLTSILRRESAENAVTRKLLHLKHNIMNEEKPTKMYATGTPYL